MSHPVSRPLTPVKEYFAPDPKSVHNTPYRNKTPDAGIVLQTDIRDDLGPYNNPDMFVCEVQDFLTSYGPCLNVTDNEDVEPLYEKMKKKGKLTLCSDGIYRWHEYRDSKPSEFGVVEAQAFKHLEPIINDVLEHVRVKGHEKTDMQFISVPYKELTSDIPGSDHKIDGCFIAEPSTSQYNLSKLPNRQINVPGEYKKKRDSNNRAIAHLQILGACHHIMNEDIRRMWIYGLTFEDHLCSVWYFSRSHSVKTLVFDWIKDPKVFVHVLLAFAKATPRELGIDPTVHLGRENKDGTTSFVYEVPNGNAKPSFYKTVQALSDPRKQVISGRTTRVWTVVEVSSATGEQVIVDKPEVILKDVWLNEGSKSEAENIDSIFKTVDDFVENGIKTILANNPTATRESLVSQDMVKRTMARIIEDDPRFRSFDQVSKARLASNLTNNAYKSLFLTKLHAWKGEACKPLGNQVWRCPALFSHLPIQVLEQATKPLVSANTRQATTQNSTQPMVGDKQHKEQKKQEADHRYRRFVPKRQSRFIYKEVCTTLQNLDTILDVVDVLCQTMDAMHILFLAGWVHRDLSSNNIMAYRSNSNKRWSVKLADLEFSLMMVDPTREASADPRTGTPFFMPVEILNRAYLLKPYHLWEDGNDNKNESTGDNLSDDVVFVKKTSQDDNSPKDEDLENKSVQDNIPEGEFSNLGDIVFSDDDESKFPTRKKRDIVSRVKKHRTLAEQLNASMMGEDYVANLQRFTPIHAVTTVPPDPHWDKIPPASASVKHNYQHDLESIWWILLWIILCRIKTRKTLQLEGNESQDFLMYFDHDINKFHPRKDLFTTDFAVVKQHLDQRISKHFWRILDELRESMYEAYLTRAVFGHLEVSESYTDIQVQFAMALRDLRADPGPWRDLRLTKPIPPTTTANKTKQDPSPQVAPQVTPGEPNPSPQVTPGNSQKRERGSAEYEDENDGDNEDEDGPPKKARKKARKHTRNNK